MICPFSAKDCSPPGSYCLFWDNYPPPLSGQGCLIKAALVKYLSNPQSVPDVKLSQRQMEVWGYVAQGKSNKVIAQQIHVSEETVKNFLSQILLRLGVTNRTEAAAMWWRKNKE